jgi:hypothetical protein
MREVEYLEANTGHLLAGAINENLRQGYDLHGGPFVFSRQTIEQVGPKPSVLGSTKIIGSALSGAQQEYPGKAENQA